METEPDVPAEVPLEPESLVRPSGPPTLRLWAMLAAVLGLAVVIGSFVSLTYRPPNDPADVIRSAIRAHGGEEALARTWVGRYTAEMIDTREPRVTGHFVELFDFPLRVRRRLEVTGGRRSQLVEYVDCVEGGWQRASDGRIVPLNPKPSVMGAWNALFPRLPSLFDDEMRLMPGSDMRVEGREAVGVIVRGPNGGGVLHFDRETRLLARALVNSTSSATGTPFQSEIHFTDYAETAGVMMPRRVVLHVVGNPTYEYRITSMTFLAGHDDAAFDTPAE